ncbi:MAG: DegT/DnrJ/EryC1/StrS family aminotransferase [Thermodesulfobacteriota bacterium]
MPATPAFLPFALPLLGEEEIAEVTAVMRSGWLTTGPRARAFEQEFAAFVGGRYALAVNSATAGLHLALEAIGIGPGDRVLTSPYTFTATAEVVRYLRADVVFADIEPGTCNLDPTQAATALARHPEVRAIMPVHFAGQACDMAALGTLAARHGARIVEDAAHALPTTWDGRLIGGFGDLTVFSFYVTKTLATGEGGMVVTDNPAHAERISTMRLHGINRDVFDRYSATRPSWYYEVVAPGFKYNMTDLAAAIGIHQLRKVNAFQARRAWIAGRYAEAFRDLPLRLPAVVRPQETHAWHLFVIQLDLPSLAIGRDRFIELMCEAGIGTSVHFIPLHLQPYWRDRYGLQPEDFPEAYGVYQRAVSLPIYPKMTDEDVERVIAAVRGILLRYQA